MAEPAAANGSEPVTVVTVLNSAPSNILTEVPKVRSRCIIPEPEIPSSTSFEAPKWPPSQASRHYVRLQSRLGNATLFHKLASAHVGCKTSHRKHRCSELLGHLCVPTVSFYTKALILTSVRFPVQDKQLFLDFTDIKGWVPTALGPPSLLPSFKAKKVDSKPDYRQVRSTAPSRF